MSLGVTSQPTLLWTSTANGYLNIFMPILKQWTQTLSVCSFAGQLPKTGLKSQGGMVKVSRAGSAGKGEEPVVIPLSLSSAQSSPGQPAL